MGITRAGLGLAIVRRTSLGPGGHDGVDFVRCGALHDGEGAREPSSDHQEGHEHGEVHRGHGGYLGRSPLLHPARAPGFLEMVGLIFSSWSAYRYLIFGPNREELTEKVRGFYK